MRVVRSVAIFCALLTAVSMTALAQGDDRNRAEQNLDVTVQLVVGSNAAGGRSELPGGLAALSRQLGSTMPYSSYRLAETLFGRVASGGGLEYKSISHLFGGDSDRRMQTFLEMTLANLRPMPTAKGGNSFQAQAFRFGARVPTVAAVPGNESGAGAAVVNYESIGLNLNRIGIPENVPTLIGTLNMPGDKGTIFVVVTIKPVDM